MAMGWEDGYGVGGFAGGVWFPGVRGTEGRQRSV